VERISLITSYLQEAMVGSPWTGGWNLMLLCESSSLGAIKVEEICGILDMPHVRMLVLTDASDWLQGDPTAGGAMDDLESLGFLFDVIVRMDLSHLAREENATTIFGHIAMAQSRTPSRRIEVTLHWPPCGLREISEPELETVVANFGIAASIPELDISSVAPFRDVLHGLIGGSSVSPAMVEVGRRHGLGRLGHPSMDSALRLDWIVANGWEAVDQMFTGGSELSQSQFVGLPMPSPIGYWGAHREWGLNAVPSVADGRDRIREELCRGVLQVTVDRLLADLEDVAPHAIPRELSIQEDRTAVFLPLRP
jgi:hypothetical protein